MSVMQRILKIELEQIVWLQKSARCLEPTLAFLSTFLGPSNVFKYLIPIVGAFDSSLLVELILSETLADCVGLALKWLANEDRPFWWVRETSLYTDQTRPTLRQHPLTCEATSGSPSGHNIITTAFMYLLCKHGAKYIQNHFHVEEKRIKWIRISMFLATSAMMWPIRMYFGCHFLHQCFLGSLVGYAVVKSVEHSWIRQKIYEMDKTLALVWSTGIAASLLTIYLGLRIYGIDPHWSVKMAFKWCENPHYVAHESTPIYSIVKDFGTISGLAFAAPLRNLEQTTFNRWKSVPFTVTVIILNYFLLAQTPKNHGPLVFLGYTYIVNLLFTYSIVGIMSKVCSDRPKTD